MSTNIHTRGKKTQVHTTAAASAAAASAHSDRVIIAVQAADVRALAVIGLEDHLLREPSEKKENIHLRKKPQAPKKNTYNFCNTCARNGTYKYQDRGRDALIKLQSSTRTYIHCMWASMLSMVTRSTLAHTRTRTHIHT